MMILEGDDWSHISLAPQVFIMETSLLEKSVQPQSKHVLPSLQWRLQLSDQAGILDALRAEYKEGELTAELKLELSTECV